MIYTTASSPVSTPRGRPSGSCSTREPLAVSRRLRVPASAEGKDLNRRDAAA